MHLADSFIQSDSQCILLYVYCVKYVHVLYYV